MVTVSVRSDKNFELKNPFLLFTKLHIGKYGN